MIVLLMQRSIQLFNCRSNNKKPDYLEGRCFGKESAAAGVSVLLGPGCNIPTRLVNLTDALPDVPYCAGCDARGNVTEESLREAATAAKARKRAVVVVGLPESCESEAFDRDHMKLPEGHNTLVEAVAAANPNTEVFLLGGSAMEIPWENKVKAILYMGLPSQAGGQAAAP